MADRVRHVSRDELERREDALLQILDTLHQWTEAETETELAEVRFLLRDDAGPAA